MLVAGKGEAMANAEQLAILKQGVEAWNEWRVKNLDVRLDLREADFMGTKLDDRSASR
jgi:hypothetical protein